MDGATLCAKHWYHTDIHTDIHTSTGFSTVFSTGPLDSVDKFFPIRKHSNSPAPKWHFIVPCEQPNSSSSVSKLSEASPRLRPSQISLFSWVSTSFKSEQPYNSKHIAESYSHLDLIRSARDKTKLRNPTLGRLESSERNEGWGLDKGKW